MKGKKARLPLAILFSGVMIISFTFYFYQVFFASNFLVGQDSPYYLEIEKGTLFKDLVSKLNEEEVLSDALSFSFVAKILGYQDRVRSGRYLISPNTNNIEVVRKLRAGNQVPVKVTFNNARTKKDLSEKICKYLEMDPEDLEMKLRDPDFCEKYGKDTFSIVNIFIPNTYEMYWQQTPEELCDRMQKEYQHFWNQVRKDKAAALNLKRDEVTVLASIVQAETRWNDEKPRIAGVYLNRLKKEIPLQADPTLVFASGNFELKRVLNVHKEIDSPYNTYKNKGLPPGPINIPSIKSLDAVLDAEDHKYYYFCAKEDFSGYHNFAATIREHINNANRYQRALNRAKIK